MKLTKVKIYKYKCFQKEQEIDINPEITTIVGMNESGKTSFLTALAKENYFDSSDDEFKFDTTLDYPRKELVHFQKDTEDKGQIIECTYEIDKGILSKIETDLGKGVFKSDWFSRTTYYEDDSITYNNIVADENIFIKNKLTKYKNISESVKNELSKLSKICDVSTFAHPQDDNLDSQKEYESFKSEIAGYLKHPNDSWNNLGRYILDKYIEPAIPKFWYYDDYYPLSGNINITQMISRKPENETKQQKNERAFFELASIEPQEILDTTNYENHIAKLEASANEITETIFKYWTTNKNLDIEFKIKDNEKNKAEKVLDIRVKNNRYKITLPLDERSKGFNWFFSFIVWFSKIQSDKNSDYILLLDEPGLNLHASAQNDLLRFIEDLSKNYQIIYTTHSPFMIASEHLDRVRTCFETDDGSILSDSIQEKDPNTLFPLQAALGYDIAQNLFISKNNLLVEGPADLIYLTIMSNLLEEQKKEYLREDITIVPVGGLDKVSTFVSLLRGQKLNLVCLLDSFNDQKSKKRLEDLVAQKIIKQTNILFYSNFIDKSKNADVEDMFTKNEYLNYFNAAFSGEYAVSESDLDVNITSILQQINKFIDKERFNHYRTANKMNQMSPSKDDFSKETFDRFERLFKDINKLFDK